MGKLEEKEKQIELTPAEKKRHAHFEKLAENLEEQGYKRSDLTIGIIKANVVTCLISIPMIILAIVLFVVLHPDYDYVRAHETVSSGPLWLMAYAVLVMGLIVVHELVHGITWSFFCENGFKDIEFGFKWKLLTPYCTCLTPLKKNHYILGAMMPLIVLGIIPTVLSLVFGSIFFLLVGLMMIAAAGGDILLTIELLKYRSKGSDVVIYDHPSQPGSIVFER